jgi:hypothetical protein
MARALLSLMALVAMALMPAAMGLAPAAAHPMTMSMDASDSGHCDSQDGGPGTAPGMVDCKATCGALTASPARVSEPLPLPSPPPAISPARRFAGIILDIATPPPRIG